MTVPTSVAGSDAFACDPNRLALRRPIYGSTSLGLIQDVQTQDVEAWREFVQLYTPLVLYWCRIAGVSRADAEDINQEVFVAVARAIPRFRRDRAADTFRGWLRTVCRNKLLDFFRTRQKSIEAAGGTWHHVQMTEVAVAPAQSSPASASTSPPSDAPIRAAAAFVRNEFSETSWHAFWRTAVDGQPANEVADELGMTHAAVRKAKSRVLHRLREELQSPLEAIRTSRKPSASMTESA